MSNPEQTVLKDEGIDYDDDMTVEDYAALDFLNFGLDDFLAKFPELLEECKHLNKLYYKARVKNEQLKEKLKNREAELATALEKNKQLEEVLDTMSEVLGKRQRI
jgi:hypothetical protein